MVDKAAALSTLEIPKEYKRNRSIIAEDRLRTLSIKKMPDLEYIERYYDKLPLLKIRKLTWRFYTYLFFCLFSKRYTQL
jgi:hypothetical protein